MRQDITDLEDELQRETTDPGLFFRSVRMIRSRGVRAIVSRARENLGQICARMEILEQRQLLSATWFVSPSGSDQNPGTLAAPFQTIQHAATVAEAGDDVEIRAGTYRETVTPAHSGSAGSAITFEAYNGENVTISGADPVSGWSQYSGNIYSASLPWDLGEGNNEVFVNGSAINEAMFPNSGIGDFSHPTSLLMQSTQISGNTAVIYNSSLNQPANTWKGAIIQMNPGQAWEHQTGTVLSSTPGSVTVSFVYHDSSTVPSAGNTFYLFGKFQALDSAGEWYRDPTTGKLFAWMPNSGDPSSQDVEVKRRTYAFNLNDVHDITLHDINLFAASIVTSSNSRDTVINGITSLYASQNLQIPEGWWISPVGQGIALMGADSIVENSTIAFTSGEGIVIEGANCIVENNVVHDAVYTGSNLGAITLYSDGDTVDHNTVYNSGRDGIKASVCQAIITYNIIHDVGLQTTGAGGIYTANTDGEGSVMAYNEIYNIHSGGVGGTALFANTGTSDWSIHDNQTYNVDYGVTMNLTSNKNLIYNNTLQATKMSVNTSQTGNWAGTQIYNNIYTMPVLYTTGATVYNNASSMAAANSSQGAGSFTAGATGVVIVTPPVITIPPASGTGTATTSGSGASGIPAVGGSGGTGATSGTGGPTPPVDSIPAPVQAPIVAQPIASATPTTLAEWRSRITADRAALANALKQRAQSIHHLVAQQRSDRAAYRAAQRQVAAVRRAMKVDPASPQFAVNLSALAASVLQLFQTLQADTTLITADRRSDFTGVLAKRRILAADLNAMHTARRQSLSGN